LQLLSFPNISISTSLFYEMVADERMPPPVKVGHASLWDRLELDAAFDNLKDKPGTESSLLRRLRELEEADSNNVRRRKTEK
jgi:predicted DNA-binding transcriptional regulator AlpA